MRDDIGWPLLPIIDILFDMIIIIITCSLKKKSKFNIAYTIYKPFFLYFDDFQVNNPLGSHSSSVLDVNYSFPTAHKKNFFVAALFNSKDIKNIGNNKCFYDLVEEINESQNIVVDLKLPGRNLKVEFILGLVVGDNLGINTVLGFSRSFSSNFFVTFAYVTKKVLEFLQLRT